MQSTVKRQMKKSPGEGGGGGERTRVGKVLPSRFNFGDMREGVSDTRRIHRQTFNTGAELLAYSALHPASTLFYKLKLAIIHLRISKLYSDWLIQCFWNKTKD